MATRRPSRRKKFNRLPIPKYLNIRKVVKRIETKKPLLLLARIKEKVKRQARKNIKKKRGSISTELGLKK